MERWWTRVVDGALVLVVLAAGLAEIWVPFASRTGDGDPGWSTVQVLIMSGDLDVGDAHRHFLPKPFNRSEFIAAVDTLLALPGSA